MDIIFGRRKYTDLYVVIPLAALLPIAAALYTIFTPGYLFADIRNGYEMLAVYLIGIMAILLLRDRYFISMLFLPIALSVTYIGLWSVYFQSH